MSVTPFIRTALCVWHLVLDRNRGVPYNYILNKLPKVPVPIFVDASTSWGVGGVHGSDYFTFPHCDLRPFIRASPGWES